MKKLLFLIVMTLLSSCKNKQVEQPILPKSTDIKQVKQENPKFSPFDGREYISETTLLQLVKNTTSIEIDNQFPTPFDTIKFNKVIAYDFDGNEEPYSDIINRRNGKFVPVILRQKALNAEQISFLIDFLTNNDTYGGTTAACFVPHLGFVFYENETMKYQISICLDCNYLYSTSAIPATDFHQLKHEGESYSLYGFSESGKKKIVEISKQLGLDYGEVILDKKTSKD